MKLRPGSVACVALALAAPVLLWDGALRRAVARDVDALADESDPRHAEAQDELRALGVAAVPDLVRLFAVDGGGTASAVREGGTTKRAGALTLPVMDLLRAEPDPAVIAALVKALDDDDSDVRHYSGLVLAWIGAPVVPALSALVHDAPEPRRRTAAAWILSLMGADGVPALPALQGALQDPDLDVRRMARYAIGQLSEGNEAYWDMVRTVREKPR